MKEKVLWAKERLEKVYCFCKKHKKTFQIIFWLLVLLRLWLFLTMNWYVEMESYYDSRLEINTAVNMTSLKWGGAYSKFTLCKGLAFPLFLTIIKALSVPYPVGLFGVVALASFIFARCLKPVVKRKGWRKVIFLFVLYNPVGLGGEMAYPYRNALVPWTVLIVVSCLFTIYLRRKEKIKELLPWALTGLVFAGFFWNLREDSIWFLPFIIGGSAAIIIHWFLEKKGRKKKVDTKKKAAFSLIVLCPLIGILVWNTGLSILNKTAYGIYTTEDRTKTFEAKVLGQLISIDDGADFENDYWVSSEAIELAKQVSPSFASLDLSPFDAWPRIGDYSIWALRDSMSNSGYYTDASTTNKMYEKIYNELKQGFSDNKLKKKAGIMLSDTSGIYSLNEIIRPIGISFNSLVNHVTYGEYMVNPEQVRNVREEGDIVLYENVLGVSLVRSEEQLAAIGADAATIRSNSILKKKQEINRIISNGIINAYSIISWAMFVFGLIGLGYASYMILWKKIYGDCYIESVIFMVGLILLVLLNAYLVGLWGTGFGLTAEANLFKAYTTAETILISVFEIIGFCCFLNIFKRNKRKEKK